MKLNGIVTAHNENNLWVVETDGEGWMKRMFLLPQECLAPGMRVGMKVELEYRTGMGYGKWVITREVKE